MHFMFPGDTLLLYSDGVPEAVNAAGDEFGDDRFIAALLSLRGVPAEDVVGGIRTTLAQFVRDTPPSDDVTVVAVRRTS
jgi:sigma-B regulation protein RsbU (phosphoserine phosphatase)